MAVKICCVIPSLQAGGMERVMAQLLDHFSLKKNTEIHLILYGIERKIFYSVPENVRVHKPNFQFNNKHRFFYTIRTLWFLRKKIIQVNPDTVLSFGELWNNFVLLALFSLSYPIYVSDRSNPHKNLGIFHNFLRKWLYSKATGIIAQTNQAKSIYQGFLKASRIKVIGNPIREIRNNHKTYKENIILSVGRLIKTKHHDELIKLFVSLKKKNWKLIIVGGDAQRQHNMHRLQELINGLNAQDHVILAGEQKHVEDFYLRSKIFAFASSSEGFPNVIGEAMSAGLPVVAFDCTAGPSDMIEDGKNGYLVEVFNYTLFKQRLLALIDDAELRKKIGHNALKSIQLFKKEIIAEEYYKFITSNFKNIT